MVVSKFRKKEKKLCMKMKKYEWMRRGGVRGRDG